MVWPTGNKTSTSTGHIQDHNDIAAAGTALEATVDDLDTRVTALEGSAPPPPPPPPSGTQLVGIKGVTEDQWTYMFEQYQANTQPYKRLFDLMRNSTSGPRSTAGRPSPGNFNKTSTYTPEVWAYVHDREDGTADPYNTDDPKGGWQIQDDGTAALVQALMAEYNRVTSGPNENAHRNNCLAILNGYAANNRGIESRYPYKFSAESVTIGSGGTTRTTRTISGCTLSGTSITKTAGTFTTRDISMRVEGTGISGVVRITAVNGDGSVATVSASMTAGSNITIWVSSSKKAQAALYATWGMPQMILAADIARAKWGWNATDFETWLRNYIWPFLGWSSANNVQAGGLETLAAIACFLRDDSLVTWVCNMLDEFLPTMISMPTDTVYARHTRKAFVPYWPWKNDYNTAQYGTSFGPAGVNVPATFTDSSINSYSIANWQTAWTSAGNAAAFAIEDLASNWAIPGIMREQGRDWSHSMAMLGAMVAALETVYSYGRTDLWDRHYQRIQAGLELACSYMREAVKKLADDPAVTTDDWFVSSTGWYPTGKYSIATGLPAAGATATDNQIWPYNRWYGTSRVWVWGGAWGDHCIQGAYNILTKRYGSTCPNAKALLDGWSEDSNNYGGQRTFGLSTGMANTYFEASRFMEDFLMNAQDGGSPPNPPPANEPPTAALSVTMTGPKSISVDATGSTAKSPATISTYKFDWGDGTSSTATSTATGTKTYTGNGPYTVTVTVTDSNGLSDTETRDTLELIALDEFGRSLTVSTTRSWGSADVGGAYTAYPTSGSTQAGVNGSAGVTWVTTGHIDAYQYLTTPSATDFEMVVKARWTTIPTVGDNRIVLHGRHARSGSSITSSVTGGVFFDSDNDPDRIVTSFGGTGVAVVSSFTPSVTAPTANQWFWIKFRVQGQSASLKYWLDGSSEPATWTSNMVLSDLTALSANGFSIQSYGFTGPASAPYQTFPLQTEFDRFWVHKIS